MNIIRKRNNEITNLFQKTARSYANLRSVATLVFTMLLGITPVGSAFCPFGMAYFIASSERILPMAVGLFLSAASSGVTLIVPMLCATAGAAVKYALQRSGRLTPSARLYLSTAFAVIGGVARLSFFYDDYGEPLRTILLAVTLPCFCFLFLGLDKRTAVFGAHHETVSRLAVVFVAVRLASVVRVERLSLGVVVSVGVILFCTQMWAKRSSPNTLVLGCLVGFVCGLGCNDLATVPTLGLLGLVCGFLAQNGEVVSIICASTAAIAFACATSGVVFGLATAIHIVFGSGVYLSIRNLPERYVREALGTDHKSMCVESATAVEAEAKCIDTISESFSSISNALSALATIDMKETEIGTLPLASCVGCCGCYSCGIDEFELKSAMARYVNDGIELPRHLIERCPNSESVVESLNNKSNAKRDVIAKTAMKYGEFSRILSSIRELKETNLVVDTELSLRLSESLTRLGLSFSHSRVRGVRTRSAEVYDVQLSDMECSSSLLRSTVSQAIEREVGDPFFLVCDDCVSIRFETIPLCEVEYSKLSATKKGESSNGDTVTVFERSDGMFFGLIGDGMGSGSTASLCSRLGTILLEKLMLVGSDRDEVMQLLNKLMLEKGDEVFTTIDLLAIDRLTMKAVVTKAGAAPTFVVRDKKLTTVFSRSAPLGLFDTTDASNSTFELKKGDVILMMSDGAVDGDRVPPWLEEYVADGTLDSLPISVLNAELMEQAKKEGSGSDDVTVLVVRIK